MKKKERGGEKRDEGTKGRDNDEGEEKEEKGGNRHVVVTRRRGSRIYDRLRQDRYTVARFRVGNSVYLFYSRRSDLLFLPPRSIRSALSVAYMGVETAVRCRRARIFGARVAARKTMEVSVPAISVFENRAGRDRDGLVRSTLKRIDTALSRLDRDRSIATPCAQSRAGVEEQGRKPPFSRDIFIVRCRSKVSTESFNSGVRTKRG